MTNLNKMSDLEELLSKRKQEMGWITVEKILNCFNYPLDKLCKIENKIIGYLKRKFRVIDNTKVIEVKSLIDTGMNLNVNSNYLFEINAIIEMKKELINIIHNI